MKTKECNNNQRASKCKLLLALLLVLLFFTCFANAKILANVSSEKQQLQENEISFLEISFYNDEGMAVNDLSVRVEGGEQIVFVEETDRATIAKKIDFIGAHETEKIRLKMKLISAKKPSATIYVYYGTGGATPFAAATYIEAVESPILVKATASKKTSDGSEKAIIDFKITNFSKTPITAIAAEMLAPQGFEIKTEPLIKDVLLENESAEKSFEALAPLNAAGEQTLKLSYGYMDGNSIHYFEKTFLLNFERDNRLIYAAIGIIVLLVAVYFFVSKTKGQKEVQGTQKKK